MKDLSHFSKISAFTFIASLSFSLVACGDSSSASGDDVPGSSDSGAALGSSGSVPAGMEGLPDDVLASYSILPQCGDEIVHPEGSCNSITGADGKAYLFECVGTQWVYNQDCEEPMCLTAASKAEHPECQFPECNAESEGLVQERVTGNPKYGQGYVFYRCEQGKWAERSAWVECDTAGVTEGELCRVQTGSPGMMGYGGSWNCYKYAGNGTWNDVDCPTEPEKECSAENEGLVDSVWSGDHMNYHKCENGEWKTGVFACDTAGVTVGAICQRTVQVQAGHMVEDRIVTYIYDGDGIWYEHEIPHLEVNCAENGDKKGLKTYGNETGSYTEYYTCLNGELQRLSEMEYYCSEDSDTCSYELNGKTQYSLRKDSSWVKCDYDSTVGYCCTDDDFYREAGEKYYYCGKGTWLQPELVPHQYTDPRKDSLTDAEFDILDLPKDASVGDVAGGLMEDCYYASALPKDGVYWHVETEVSEYCVSRKYYTYGADGTWGVYSIPNEYRACTSEIEGEEFWDRRSSPDYNFYDINKCESSEWKHVGYNFSRSKKK